MKDVDRLTEENKKLMQQITRLNNNIRTLKTKQQGSKVEVGGDAGGGTKKKEAVAGGSGAEQSLLKSRKMPETLGFRNLLIDDKKDISRLE